MPNLEENPGAERGIAKYVTKALPLLAENSRAITVVAGLITMIVGGVLVQPGLSSDVRAWLVGGAGVFLFAVIVLLYLLARETTRAEVRGKGLSAVRRAVETVNGHWWQIIHNDKTPGLSMIRLQLSPLPGRHRLGGEKWGPDGDHLAQWSSRAVAIQDIQPFKLFYIWDGTYNKGTQSVSGVGTFQFPSEFETLVTRGTGWFTTGNVDQLDFQEHSSVTLRRAPEKDVAVMAENDRDAQKALIAERYTDWKREFDH